MGSWHACTLDFLKNNKKMQITGGRDRTPDLQPLNALRPTWLPLEHLCLFVIILKENNEIQKRVLVDKNKKNARTFERTSGEATTHSPLP